MKIKIMAWICILAMTVGVLSGCKQQDDSLSEQSVAGSESFFEEDTENVEKETESAEQIVEEGDGERLPVEFTPYEEEPEQTTVGEKTETNSSSVEGTVNDPILQEPADPEDKRYNTTTIEADFEPGIVCVILTKKVSDPHRRWPNEIFSCVEFESVKLLTPLAKQGECYYNLEEFHQQYMIVLKEKSKQAVLDAIQKLEKLNYVYAATASRTMTMDFENETTEGADDVSVNEHLS